MNKEDAKKLLISVFGDDIDECLVDTASGWFSDEYNLNKTYRVKNETADVLNELTMKLKLDEIINYSDLNKVTKAIKKYHDTFSSHNKMMISDLEEMTENPRVRFKLSLLNEVQKATWGLREGMYLIGAASQVGKTAIIINLALDILNNNEESKVYIFTLDDTVKKFKHRLVSCQTFFESGDINKTVDVDYAFTKVTAWDDTLRSYKIDPVIAENRREAIETLKGFVGTKRLNIFDGSYTADKIESLLTDIDKENSIVLIDAVYRVECEGKNDYEADEARVKWCKDLSNTLTVPCVYVKDIRKAGNKEKRESGARRKRSGYTTEDLRGSVYWDYEPDCSMIMYQHNSDSKKPFTNNIIMDIDKNKISGIRSIIQLELQWKKTVYTQPVIDFNTLTDEE